MEPFYRWYYTITVIGIIFTLYTTLGGKGKQLVRFTKLKLKAFGFSTLDDDEIFGSVETVTVSQEEIEDTVVLKGSNIEGTVISNESIEHYNYGDISFE